MEEFALSRHDRSGHKIATNAVPWRDLRDWLALVEASGGLRRISATVDPVEELAAITFLAGRTVEAPALLFDRLCGDEFGMRVLSNMLGASKERYALAVGLDPALSICDMIAATRAIMRRRIAPVYVDKRGAPVNEIILRGEQIDITRFPTPKFWPGDGGRYIGTGDVTFTRDLATGRINVGVYRQMIEGPSRVAMYCSPGKHGRLDREAWWAQGKSCEVVSAYGIDPVLFMVGAQSFAANESELDIAGGLMGRPVEVTEAEFVSLPIPALAEIVIEGFAHPGDTAEEGPRGEFTGYYGNVRSPQPVIDIKAVHCRRSPIMTAALMARYPSCEIGVYYAIMRSARILDDLENIGVPGVVATYAHPAAASGWGMVNRGSSAAVSWTRGPGVGARRTVSGRRLLYQVDYCGGRGRRSHRFRSGDVGPEHALQSVRRHRLAAQYLVDGSGSQSVSAGIAALWLQGADKRLQAAPPFKGVSQGNLAATRSL